MYGIYPISLYGLYIFIILLYDDVKGIVENASWNRLIESWKL